MRTKPPPLLPLFRSRTQVDLLGLLLLQPDRTWTLQTLSARVRAPQSSVHRELRRFVDAGLVRRDDRQRPHGYAAATDAPAYEPLRALVDMTAGVPVRLANALDDVPGVVAASIHGSWASGRIRPDSDLDVVVVTEGDRRAAQRAVRRVGREIGRDIDASVVSVDDYEELMRSKNPFLAGVIRGPRIDVVGDLAAIGA